HTDVTAAAATVALGLLYLRSNDAEVATCLAVPPTISGLEHVRPDLLLLRVACRNLILWEGISPTSEWVEAQVPGYVGEVADVVLSSGSMQAVSSLSHSEKFAKVIHAVQNQLSDFGNSASDADVDGVINAWVSIITGACFAMGLRYAGSADKMAYRTLLHYMDLFIRATSLPANSFENKILRTALKAGLNVLCTSICCVMAGTGNLEVLKRLRRLHGRVSDTTTYGDHMAVHMALGLLFLGGGQYTLDNSNRAVVALFCALYPRYPSRPNDNRPHLQVFRHLWVLAAEPRCFVVRETDTCRPVYAPISVVTKNSSDMGTGDGNEEILELVAPCLLPDLRKIKSIIINSPRYWPIKLDFIANDFAEMIRMARPVFVKERPGHLDFVNVRASGLPRWIRLSGPPYAHCV
ncbi:MAG: hypothetical protein BJ554DRAFT_5129, partial [Olpidium bornovanus]